MIEIKSASLLFLRLLKPRRASLRSLSEPSEDAGSWSEFECCHPHAPDHVLPFDPLVAQGIELVREE